MNWTKHKFMSTDDYRLPDGTRIEITTHHHPKAICKHEYSVERPPFGEWDWFGAKGGHASGKRDERGFPPHRKDQGEDNGPACWGVTDKGREAAKQFVSKFLAGERSPWDD